MNTSTILANMAGSFFMAVTFAILFNAPKNCVPVGGLISTLGWMSYLSFKEYSGSVFGASVLCGLILALCSHFASRKFHTPSQIFFVPGLIPLVPGITFFRAVQALIAKDYIEAGHIFLKVIYISVGVACAIGISKVLIQVGSLLLKRNGQKEDCL